jgi:hypothetical protein
VLVALLMALLVVVLGNHCKLEVVWLVCVNPGSHVAGSVSSVGVSVYVHDVVVHVLVLVDVSVVG